VSCEKTAVEKFRTSLALHKKEKRKEDIFTGEKLSGDIGA
jgi:hypothetical protein